jgi:hypothetical protein
VRYARWRLSKDEARKITVKQPSNHWLLTWRISALRSCVDIALDDFGSWGRHGLCRRFGSWGRHGLYRRFSSWGRRGLREYGSSRMHWRYPEGPAMVGAEPNKMRLGKLGTCLAFRHAGWRAISQ